MNRKRLFFAAVTALILTLVFACAAFASEGDPLKVSMEISTNTFTGPKSVTVSISVRNSGEGDMAGPVTLYGPDGKQVEDFGEPVLAAGSSKNWSGTWKVTEAMLEAGKIQFRLRYPVYDDNGDLKYKTKIFNKAIIYTGAVTSVDVNRTISPTVAQKDQEVAVTYEIVNTGNVDITNITIKENSSVSTTSAKIEKVPAGEKTTYTFTVKMGTKDLTSAGTVTYKSGGKTYTVKKDPTTIKYGKVNLSASVSADKKGGAPGETVNLTVTLKNTGTVDFTGVNVTDDVLGTLVENGTIPAGETVTIPKSLVITENQDIRLNVSATDGTGEPLETASDTLKVIATDPTKQVSLSLFAQADKENVYDFPATVRFTFTVTNDSAVDVSNVAVKAINTTLYTFDTIPAGESRSFSRETALSMVGTYQFTASCKDQLGQTVTFPGNMILIQKVAPTPVPTEAPIPTPPPRPTPVSMEYLQSGNEEEEARLNQYLEITELAKWIAGGIAAFLFLLLLIGAIRRIAAKSRSAKAVDRMERGNYRDYSITPKGKRNEIRDNYPEEPAETAATEDTVQDSELMAETLERLYSTPAKKTADYNPYYEGTEAAPAEEIAQPAEMPETAAAETVTETVPEIVAETVNETKPEVIVEGANDFARRRRRK